MINNLNKNIDWHDQHYGDRLNYALEHGPEGKKSKSDLARALKVSPSAIIQVTNKNTKALTAENTAKAAQYLRISNIWLASGRGSMLSSLSDPALLEVPIIGALVGSEGKMVIEKLDNQAMVRTASEDPDAVAYVIKSSEYEPYLELHDIVMIEPNAPILPGDTIFYQTDDDTDIAKFLYEHRAGTLHVKSWRNGQSEQSISPDKIIKKALVSARIAAAKYRSLTD